MEAESPTQPIPTNPAQCDESRVAQIVIISSNAECITNQESDKLNAHSNPQCEMESGQNIQNIVLESTDPVLLVDSLSQTDSIANISSNQNELETANNLFHTHETSQSSTGKEMEIEQNDSSCTAQSTSVLEDTTNIPETSQPESSQHDSGNISHSNQDESENTQSSTKKEIISVPNKANNTSTPEHDVPVVEPSCSDSQKTLESSDRTEQEVISDFSNTTTDVDTQVPSTSGNYAANTSKSSTKLEPGDLLVEVGTKNEFYDFGVPKVSIYGENTGSRFYDVPDDLVSKPIIPTMLSEAFSSLPVFGRPQRRSLLPEFQDMKIKEFVGCGLDDSEFERLAEFCSPDNLRTGKELTMASNPGQGFYPRETEKLGKNIEEFTSHHDLNIVRKHKLRVENDTKNLYAKSDAAHRPRTRGGAHGGRTRGVRTRGRGGVGLVPEVPVVVEVVEEPTAPLPQRQVRGRRRAAGRRGGVGSSRMDDLDQIEILNIEDLPLGTRHETPLHQKRGRRRNPIEILKIEDLPLGTRHETPLHQKRRRRRNPEMYHDIPTTTPAPGPSSDPGLSSSHAPPNDDDLSNFLNYGSEESGSDGEDDGLVAVLIPRVYREALDTPLDPEPAEPYVSAEAPAAINTGLAYRQDGARLPVDLFDFDWTNYPDPPVSSRERRTPFSPTIVGPTMPCTDGYTIFKTIWDHDIVQHIVDETNFYAQELTLRMMNKMTGPRLVPVLAARRVLSCAHLGQGRRFGHFASVFA